MEQFVGDTFEGVISSVTSFGFFVELDNGVEGLVHMTTLKDDYYDYIESRYALEGTHHHRVYQLGDKVEVVLVRASVEEKALDFVAKDNCDLRALNMAKGSENKPSVKGKKSGKGKVVKAKAKVSRRDKTGTKLTVARKAKKTKKNKKNKHDHKSAKGIKKKDIIAEI